MTKLKILFLESFYGGSHRDFADGLVQNSKHDIQLHTLPSRFWKWRLRGAALFFAELINNPETYDLLFVSDMLSLADLKALWGTRCPPGMLYFHENQLSYPLPKGEKADLQFGFTNITSALSAEQVIFNSHFHLSSFFSALPGFLRKMPEYRPLWVINELKQKSRVIYPGCNFPPELNEDEKKAHQTDPKGDPVVVWNHRWQFDKNPEPFFRSLYALQTKDIPFSVCLLGENFQAVPKPFLEAKTKLKSHILAYGYQSDRAQYLALLQRGNIVISTAIQENFGISVVEAIRHGCFPLLPKRLAYPEVLPDRFHEQCLYGSDEDMQERLEGLIRGRRYSRSVEMARAMGKYSWENVISEYDSAFEILYESRK